VAWQHVGLRMFNMFAQPKQMHFTGDAILPDDKAIIISNHFSDADFLYTMYTIDHFAPKRNMQLCMKKEVAKVPSIKTWVKVTKSAIISRVNPEKDLISIKNMSKGNGFPVLFVEGRVLNEETLKWAALRRNDLQLPSADHVLVPQPKGLQALLETGKYNVIYDMTLTYDGYKGGVHDFNDPYAMNCKNWLNGNTQGLVHVDIRRLELNNKSISVADCADFLNNRWVVKNARLQYFIENQEFPDDSIAEEKLISHIH